VERNSSLGIKFVSHQDKASSGAASEPQARAPLRSNTCGEMMYHFVFPRPESFQIALGVNTSRIFSTMRLKSLANSAF
jgi:hypothetical protein